MILEPDRPKHLTFRELAAVPNERRRFGWVAVAMYRTTGPGRRTWKPLAVVGFFTSPEAAAAFTGDRKRAGTRWEYVPFDDASPFPNEP